MRIARVIILAAFTFTAFAGCGDESTEPDAKAANEFDATGAPTIDAAPATIDAAPATIDAAPATVDAAPDVDAA